MENKEITIILNIQTTLEGHELFVQAMEKGIEEIRKTQGCLRATLLQDTKDIHAFSLVETWESENLWKIHLQSPVVARLTELGPNITSKWELRKFYVWL